MALNIMELEPKALRRVCNPEGFDFECTSQITPLEETIGQDRALRAIEFGVGIKSHGYNIYALGPTGTGKTTFIKSFLKEKANKLPIPDDWCYVYNFSDPHKPQALELLAGKGSEFRADMDALLSHLKTMIPQALQTEAFENERSNVYQEFQRQRGEEL
jgi:Cdc6-like AAA superfamily ATPase